MICRVGPSLILAARGEQRLWLGGDGSSYDPSRFVITSLGLLTNSEVMIASPEQPSVGLVMKLDISMLAEMTAKIRLPLTLHSGQQNLA